MNELALEFRLGASLSSRGIAWWGQGYNGWSHVDLRFANGELAGARSDRVKYKGIRLAAGFQVRPPDYERAVRAEILAKPVPADAYARWEAWARAQVDDHYDKWDILGLLLGQPLTGGAGYWICSAAAYDSLRVMNAIPDVGLDMRQVAPNALHVACLAAGFIRRVYDRKPGPSLPSQY